LSIFKTKTQPKSSEFGFGMAITSPQPRSGLIIE